MIAKYMKTEGKVLNYVSYSADSGLLIKILINNVIMFIQ